MIFTDGEIESLRVVVKERLSQKRYFHTVGVENAARYIASFFSELDVSEIAVAALLHDITKEYSEAEHKNLLADDYFDDITECGFGAILHSLTAPFVIKRDFWEYATENVLSAVRNHTLGDPDMTLFDEIIFISDYVEDGRAYKSCIEVRNKLYEDFNSSVCHNDRVSALHRATVMALEHTVASLHAKGASVHEQTVRTLDSFVAKLNF